MLVYKTGLKTVKNVNSLVLFDQEMVELFSQIVLCESQKLKLNVESVKQIKNNSNVKLTGLMGSL